LALLLLVLRLVPGLLLLGPALEERLSLALLLLLLLVGTLLLVLLLVLLLLLWLLERSWAPCSGEL
jgi:hypothetical protein